MHKFSNCTECDTDALRLDQLSSMSVVICTNCGFIHSTADTPEQAVKPVLELGTNVRVPIGLLELLIQSYESNAGYYALDERDEHLNVTAELKAKVAKIRKGATTTFISNQRFNR